MRGRAFAALACLAAIGALACSRRPIVQAASPAMTIPDSEIVLADSGDARPLTHEVPRYPYTMQMNGVSARLVAFFVIDTTGRVDMGSVRFGLEADRPFYDAVCGILPRARFEPVRRDGQARPALMIVPYTFSVSSGPDMPGPPAWMPDVRVYRQLIRQEGMDSALVTLAKRPRC